MSTLRPLLFSIPDKDPAQVVTLEVPEALYRKAHDVQGRGFTLLIRRKQETLVLEVVEARDQAKVLSRCLSAATGVELVAAAQVLIDHAHGVLCDPLPW